MNKIGVDFHVFDGKFQGSRSHLLGLYTAVINIATNYQFYFFLDDIESLKKYPAFQKANVHLVRMPHKNALFRLLFQLPLLRLRHHIDVLHTQYIIPFVPSKGNAVTIHDVLFESYPEFFTRMFVLRSKLLMKWSSRKTDILLTVSEYSKKEIIEKYGVDESKVNVTYNAVDDSKFYPGTDGAVVISEFGLKSKDYILTVGRVEPRKNHVNILKAYLALEGDQSPLVIVGQRDFGYAEFDKLLNELPPSHKVIFLSNVSDQQLPIIYRHAKIFIYPSLAEGFGMPPLEAMSSGVPVISSNNTSIPEVVEDAGILINPLSVSEIKDALHKLLTDKSYQDNLIKKGLERAQRFRWEQSALALIKAFDSYLEERNA